MTYIRDEEEQPAASRQRLENSPLIWSINKEEKELHSISRDAHHLWLPTSYVHARDVKLICYHPFRTSPSTSSTSRSAPHLGTTLLKIETYSFRLGRSEGEAENHPPTLPRPDANSAAWCKTMDGINHALPSKSNFHILSGCRKLNSPSLLKILDWKELNTLLCTF